jgi:elongation factor Ts
MAIDAQVVKALREKTGISVLECKKALEEAGGDMDGALALLRARAGVLASKKADRALGAGVVACYVHTTKQVGALVLLSCETDFVAKNEDFKALAQEIAMHAAAMRPSDAATLLLQLFIKDPHKTIGDLVADAVQKFGERVEVREVHCSYVA